MKYVVLSSLVSLSLTTAVASAQVIVDEDFESYGDTTDMLGTWSGGLGTLDTGLGNPGQSAYHPGGTVNLWSGDSFSIAPSSTEFVRLSFDMYDDATSANKRMTVGLRGGPYPIMEMGMYNNPFHYAVRLNIPGGPDWVSLSEVAVAGWHTFTADVYQDQTIFSLDLQGDGSVDFQLVTDGVSTPFSDLRFGGPSNLSSPGGGANFDNIRLEVLPVPEPTTFALIGLGSAALVMFRRRRSIG